MQVRQRDEVENHHTRPAVPIAAAIAAPHLETSDADSTREVGVRTPLPSPSGSVTAVASLSASPRAVAPSSLPSISAEPLAPATTPSLLQPQPPATLPPPATFPYRRPLIAAASNSGKSPAPAPRVSVRNLISDEVSASLPFSRRLESLAATLSAPPSLSDDGKEEIVECIEPPTAEVPPKTAAPHSSRAGAESSTALEAKSAATVKGVVRFAPVEPSPRERIVHKQP